MLGFLKRFGVSIETVEISRRLYEKSGLPEINGNVVHKGRYLGREHKGTFKPSNYLLSLLARKAKKSITVNEKAAWMFVVGKDIRKTSIIAASELEDNDYAVVLNEQGECLGYCKVRKQEEISRVIRIYDIGDYLRRE